MQTILGAGGVIGFEISKSLRHHNKLVRQVSRNPKKVNATDELISADLTNHSEVAKAVEGSEVVYLTAGLPYKYRIWNARWPVIMKNTIEACKKHKAKLVFFDNVYMYSATSIPHMTENSPIDPPSKKGKVRAHINRLLMDAVERGEISALIARSADFYGPYNTNSIFIETIYKNLKAGKKAYVTMSDRLPHSYTFTPDAGKATAMLGNSSEAYNQVWHLPTHKPALTQKEWVELTAQKLNTEPKYQVVGKGMFRFLGLFNSIMRESVEMLYQYDREYFFDSSKFEKKFNFTPTSYEEGIDQIIESEKAE